MLSILKDGDAAEELRGQAAISLGPVLEYSYIEEFEDPDDDPTSEDTFGTIQESHRNLYQDATVPKDVRRRVLEASVRAPRSGIEQPVYACDDGNWGLTAVFRWAMSVALRSRSSRRSKAMTRKSVNWPWVRLAVGGWMRSGRMS